MYNWGPEASLESLPLIYPINFDPVLIINKIEYIYKYIFVNLLIELLGMNKMMKCVQEKKIRSMKWRLVFFKNK